MLVCGTYVTKTVPVVVGNIVVVSVLTLCMATFRVLFESCTDERATHKFI